LPNRDRQGAVQRVAESRRSLTVAVRIFLDVGGNDTYACDAQAWNNATWFDPPDSDNAQVRNFSVGVDCETGDVNFLPRPEKPLGR
jgi:hypothetical protein